MSENLDYKPKILITDDREANILAMKKILKKLYVDILTATSDRDAIKLLEINNVAIILLDVQMPELDGFETAALIRGNQDIANIPIIFVTAIDRDDKYVFIGFR